MLKTAFFALLLYFAAGLPRAAGLPAPAAGAGKKSDSPRPTTKFVPLDFEKMFSAGPLSRPQPPSTLLPAGATSVALTLRSATPTVCRYSVGRDLPFDQMTPFDAHAPSSSPRTVIRGLDPDPARVNDVFIRCAAAPGAVLRLQYRSLPAARPGYPRTANLWGSWNFIPKGMQYASKIDLWLGANFTPDQIRELRRLNPDTFVLTSINTVENNNVPDDYFLRDTTGRKIEVWPNAFRLNLTRPEVARYQARYAYQRIIESGLMFDGCFFDNFMMSQRWLAHDIYDRPLQIDADGDGKPDDKDAFDKAWREGVFNELREWRKLMPWALASGHSQGYPYPEIAEIFNGQGIGFFTTDVIEGKRPFAELWKYYQAWCAVTLKPAITSVESAVPDQIAYGYDYSPQKHTPPSTWEFAKDYYPYMRFGLALTLMGNGYFSHELGDTMHGQDWWYDELDFELGEPLGPAKRVEATKTPAPELIENGGFEAPLEKTWSSYADQKNGNAVEIGRDTRVRRSGAASARVRITAAGRSGGIEFQQRDRVLQQGKTYDLNLWARADRPLTVTAIASRGAEPWTNYGLRQEMRLTTRWQPLALSFEANASARDARIQFVCGAEAGTFWLDEVSLKEHGEELYRRDFQRGVVLLNGSKQRQTVELEPGLARLQGGQAPRHQVILDDTADNSGFKAAGAWAKVSLGTKEWHAIPPYYHAWNNNCHVLDAPLKGEASWDLALRGPGTYTIQAWWAAAPDAKSWTTRAVYEIVSGGSVIATKTLDQTRTGDEWHTIAEGIKLDPDSKPFVRLKNAGTGTLVADALHVFSAERYNDGAPAASVALEPMDGIVLRRIGIPGQ